MSDQEVELGDGDNAQPYDEANEQAGVDTDAPSPNQMDNGLDSIIGVDPQTQRAEEGSNTLHPSEQPDVISSYTGQEDAAQGDETGGQYGEQAGEMEPQVASGIDQDVAQQEEPESLAAGADAQPEAESGPAAAAEEESSVRPDPDPETVEAEPSSPGPDDEPSSPGPDGEPSSPGPDAADLSSPQAPDDDPQQAAGGDPDAQAETAADSDVLEPERPAVAADGEPQPTASTSRPASGARPPSGHVASAGPRRPSAGGGASSRPGSATLLNLTPDGVGLPGAGAAGPAGPPGPQPPAPSGGGAGGSRPPSGARSSSGGGAPQMPPLPPPMPPVVPAAAVAAAPPAVLAPAIVPPIPEDQPLAPVKIERYIAPGLKAIEVEVEQGPGLPHRLVRVLMDLTQCDPKPYLGGFRNKRTGAVYHHAGTQTPRAPKYSEADRKLSRETQTVKVKQHSQQTVREQATQMERPGVELDTTYDRVVTPGRYQTADERDAIVLAATRCMQRWVRGWLGRRRACYLRHKKAEREAFLRDQELAAQTEAEEHRRREIQRRMHPRTAADFEVLYNELEAWRLQETRKIKEAGLPKEQEQGVLQQLLHKETKLLQTIDRLKINANQENKEARIQHTLNEMSKPKKFALRNGGKVDVHTPFTTRAKELQQLYNGLNLPLLTVDERLDVLLHVKWTVKEFDCDLTREVVDLIDREADLLNRGRNPKMLEGLRKRISSLFLNFIETPEFNPEAARFQIVPMDFETYLYEQVGRATAKAGTSLGPRPAVAL